MKKYLFGVIAVAAAVMSVAFTTAGKAKKATAQAVFFQYTAQNFDAASVADITNWAEVSTFTGCSGTLHKACKLEVDVTATDGTAPHRTLKNGTVLPVA